MKIKKQLTMKSVQIRTLHDAFITMLFSSVCTEFSKFEPIDILIYWYKLAFKKELTDQGINKKLIDKIRKKLLQNSGVKFPIIRNTVIVRQIKENLIFED